MTDTVANPYFTDRAWGQVFNTVGGLLPSPTREAAIQGRMAQAGYDRARTDRTRMAGDAAVAAGNRIRAGGVDPASMSGIIADLVSGADPQAMAQVGQILRAQGGAQGADPERMAQLFQGAGGNWGATEVGTRFEAGVRSGDSRYGDDQSAAASRYATDRGQEGQDRRLHVNTPEGAITTLPPNSPVAPAGSTGPVTIQGRDSTRAGANRPPLDVSPQEAARLNDNVLSLLGDTVDAQGGSSGMNVLSPEARAWVQRRAAELYQRTRDAGTAAAQAAQEFRDMYNRANPAAPLRTEAPGWFGSRRQAGLPPAAAPADPAAAAPARAGGIPEGSTATNPQTGERRIFRGGQWVPLT